MEVTLEEVLKDTQVARGYVIGLRMLYSNPSLEELEKLIITVEVKLKAIIDAKKSNN